MRRPSITASSPALRILRAVLAVLLLGGTAIVARLPLGRDRGRPPVRDRRRPLRRGGPRRRPRLPCQGRWLRARTRRLDADRARDPLLGRGRGLLDRCDRRQRRRPLSLPRRYRLPRLLPTGLRRARGPRPRQGRSAELEAVDGRPDRRARHRRDRSRLRLRLRRRLDRRHPAPGRDHPRLSARGHPDGGDGRRRHRPRRLAPRTDLGAASRRAQRARRRRPRLHPADDPGNASGRRLDRPDLPDRRHLPRSRRLAAGPGRGDLGTARGQPPARPDRPRGLRPW